MNRKAKCTLNFNSITIGYGRRRWWIQGRRNGFRAGGEDFSKGHLDFFKRAPYPTLLKNSPVFLIKKRFYEKYFYLYFYFCYAFFQEKVTNITFSRLPKCQIFSLISQEKSVYYGVCLSHLQKKWLSCFFSCAISTSLFETICFKRTCFFN